MKRLLLLLLSLVSTVVHGQGVMPEVSMNQPGAAAREVPGLNSLRAANAIVLDQIASMPTGGGYSASHLATERLKSSVRPVPPGFGINAAQAQPSYCSGATYLVFLKTLNALQRNGEVTLDLATSNALLITGQRDGEGIWGRWNANGPGTARLFYELKLGENFDDYARARPGDFMKIFWTQAVGRQERGHSVVYLGTENINGVESVKFWSSNVGTGYSSKWVPKSKIKYAIFSRLNAPRNLSRAGSFTTSVDPYLAGLLTKDSDLKEVKSLCGMGM